MGVDVPAVQALVSSSQSEAQQALLNVRAILGDINPNSPGQVFEAVHSRFHVDLPAVDETTLRDFVASIPVLADLVVYRKAKRRQSTAEGWLRVIGPDGRVHPKFHPLAAVSGRMSCSEPDLQNVPHTFEARSCFIPAPGYKLIVADYSTSQLRIAAEFTGDPELLRCFCSTPPIDPHKRTASSFLGVPMESVSGEQRAKAKAINFGCFSA